jgi:uncharacterized membrane protein YphA (DoxX/SURF4 family)
VILVVIGPSLGCATAAPWPAEEPKMIPLGIRVYGIGAVALGLVGLAWGDFALQWEPVAAGFPGRTALAYSFALLLIIAGGAVNWRPFAVYGAAALVGLYSVVVLCMHGAQIIQHPAAFTAWDGAAEQLALLAGGLAAYAGLGGSLKRANTVPQTAGNTTLRGATQGPSATPLRIATLLMGVCLLMFGVAHFLYLGFTASMVPAWLPGGQTFWAIFTGAAHIAAGIALLTGFKARLAAILLTVMFAVFGVLVHLPLLIADPHSHMSWVMNAINLSLTGAAWALASRIALAPGRLPAASAEPLS